MKTCSSCRKDKPLEDFAWKSKQDNKRQSKCKQCYSEYNKAYYHAGERTKQIKRAQSNQRVIRQKYIAWKQAQSCVVCGESAHECLELHHTDPTVKEYNPSDAILRGWKVFLQEAAKCVVVCSNCHKKIHSGRITLP